MLRSFAVLPLMVMAPVPETPLSYAKIPVLLFWMTTVWGDVGNMVNWEPSVMWIPLPMLFCTSRPPFNISNDELLLIKMPVPTPVVPLTVKMPGGDSTRTVP